MTYFYDEYTAEKYGKNPRKYFGDGTYITPKGVLFDVDSYASIAHAGGFVIPFFMYFISGMRTASVKYPSSPPCKTKVRKPRS